MNDKEFFKLHLRATIVPQQARWPAPESLHWQRLHEAADEARARVSKAYMEMDEIDGDATLTSDIKYRRRCEIATQAVADFRASKTLARAWEAVQQAKAKHSVEQHVSFDKAIKETEQGWRRAPDKIAGARQSDQRRRYAAVNSVSIR